MSRGKIECNVKSFVNFTDPKEKKQSALNETEEVTTSNKEEELQLDNPTCLTNSNDCAVNDETSKLHLFY